MSNTISDNADFWRDADDFLKSQIPDDFQEQLHKYIISKKYNHNECRLFVAMLSQSFNLYGNVAVIKNDSVLK